MSTSEQATADTAEPSEPQPDATGVVYRLEDRPPLPTTLLAALQHLLAIFVGIVTPTLVLSGPLGLEPEDTNYLISMALIVSGVATFIQVRRIGPIGSGLLSIQGTSFAFLGPMIAAGTAVGGGTAALAMIYGITLAGSFIEMALSRVMHLLRKILTPVVTGTVVCLIGLSLIDTGITDMAGGAATIGTDDFASGKNLAVAGVVLVTVIALNRSRNTYVRMGAIVIGLVVGYAVAALLGMVTAPSLSGLPVVNVPVPFAYGLDFSWSLFLPVAFIFLITAIETTGDLTATSMVSGEPVKGETYVRRIKGGVLGDGVNSALAAVFNSFPNTTFSQNNGVIQLTGVASRWIGMFVAGMLVLVGLFPVVPALVTSMPRPVLGGATIIMFGTVAAAGIKIIASSENKLDRRDVLILAVSFALGLGVELVPDVLSHLPATAQSVFGSPITTGGLTAIVLNLVLPREKASYEEAAEGETMAA
ncbi:nucleobase:cation symporter-2 family protein [Nocardioides bruguierae]|uniref:nucleobase:cation symporter-2 family protein n=1 Tax=Nocardioides bruguierae TaxID=2945102 RepID=UPI0020226A38|nr:nucleobase:cation symporter-2 family protein [Nocardioides bruguierae]MCL8025343.1 purine permease [Nocardioides bruguierae]